MTAKERDAAFRHWQSVILRETRDLASLERIGAHALQDRDVRADAMLQNLVRAELERCRSELQRDQQSETALDLPPKYRLGASRRDDAGWQPLPSATPEPRAEARPPPQAPVPAAPAPALVTFRRLAQTFSESLVRGDENEARATWEQMLALQEENSEIIPASALEQYEQRIKKLRARLVGFRSRIAAMAQQALVAVRRGDAQAAAKLMRRLSAIHIAHPALLDEARLEKFRNDIVHASEGHEDGLTSRKLVERERAVAAQMKRLAAAVHEFYRVVCAAPETSAEFHRAEEIYLRILHEVRLHEEDWLTEFVLELADVLAEWSVPPPGAEQQINCFLERVRVSLDRIHTEMRRIDIKLGETEGS
jgi:hypothetical protein